MRSDPEESYEAAMRAADALFKQVAPSIPLPLSRSPQGIAPQPKTESGIADSPREPRGRILRVLDEAPSPAFTTIDAEDMPKRRGRKPGSKNKAKAISRPAKGAPVERGTTAPATDGEIAHAAKSVTRKMTINRMAEQVAGDMARTAGLPPEAAAVRQPKPAGTRRFAWHRDKPKPGEDWKRRRLPRACW